MSQDSYSETLNSLLAHLKQKLIVQEAPTLVLGNQSADLDSVVSTIVYSVYKSLTGCSWFPIINLKRSLLYLRKDVCYFMEHFGIDKDNLLFADEVMLNNKSLEKASLCLVDHNFVETDFSFLKHIPIIEIIDHHELHPTHTDSDVSKDLGQTIVVDNCASCASLVALKLKQASNNIKTPLLSNLLNMLKFTTLLDSNQLSKKKATNTDIEAYKFCTNKTNDYFEITMEDTILLNKMVELKSNVDTFTFGEMLLKDCKSTVIKNFNLGFSTLINYSISKAYSKCTHSSDLFDVLKKHSHENRLDCVVMLLNSNIEKSKEILLFKKSRLFPIKKITKAIEKDNCLNCSSINMNEYDTTAEKTFENCSSKGDMELYAFKQNNKKYTRKYIMPLITRILSKI